MGNPQQHGVGTVPAVSPAQLQHSQRRLLIFLWSGIFCCVRRTKVKNRKAPGHQKNNSGSNPFSGLLRKYPGRLCTSAPEFLC